LQQVKQADFVVFFDGFDGSWIGYYFFTAAGAYGTTASLAGVFLGDWTALPRPAMPVFAFSQMADRLVNVSSAVTIR
jgi:hypothetical protein